MTGTTWLLFWVLIAGLLVWAVVIFNRLVRARNLVRAGLADIDVQLQKRHDLVPRLVDVVRAYAGHERGLFERVAELRREAQSHPDVRERNALEGRLADELDRLIVLAEAYPELAAGHNFRQLASELVEIEDHIAHARRFYNGAVRQLNDLVQRVPDRFIAAPLGFGVQPYFSADIETRRVPEIGRLLNPQNPGAGS
ncbi:MAG: LemA family protein [Wenzhouxiangellaceae bacterium]